MVLPPPGFNESPLEAARTESAALAPPTEPETSMFTNPWRPELGGAYVIIWPNLLVFQVKN